MKKILFVMWLLSGIFTILSGDVSMMSYVLCWLMLLMELGEDMMG